MKLAYLIIDMQGAEKEQLWEGEPDRLLSEVIRAKNELTLWNVETIHVALIESPFLFPVIGSFANIDEIVRMRTDEYDLATHKKKAFIYPVADEEKVLIKNTCSAVSGALLSYFRGNNIRGALLGGLWEGQPKQGSECCVTATAMDLVAQGITPIILREATNGANFLSQRARCNRNADAGIHVWSIQKAVEFVSSPVLQIPKPQRSETITAHIVQRVFDFFCKTSIQR